MELNGGLIGIGLIDKEHAPVYGAVRAQARRQQPTAVVSNSALLRRGPVRAHPLRRRGDWARGFQRRAASHQGYQRQFDHGAGGYLGYCVDALLENTQSFSVGRHCRDHSWEIYSSIDSAWPAKNLRS